MAATSTTKIATFTADGVLFDMDGTLTDSIAAVEAAWTAKAIELGLEPDFVIAATHGRRATDNLMELVPGLRREHVDVEVDRFERSILDFADTPPQSRKGSTSSQASISRTTRSSLSPIFPLTPADNSPMIRPISDANTIFSPETALTLEHFTMDGSKVAVIQENESALMDDEEFDELVDMSVRILPGVRNMIDSLPKGSYAVATSGAKTYCHGCLSRTGIAIPQVCVTADDSRLLRGKPFPDPFLLAAADLGICPTRSVIFEDSPSGIKAAVAAGGTVIAVCTSHKREQIDNLGAHYVVDTMEQVAVERNAAGELVFTITH